MCNGMAYSMAQRRRLLEDRGASVASARDYFLLNCAHNDQVYTEILNQAELHQMQHDSSPNIGDLANRGNPRWRQSPRWTSPG